MNRRWLQSISRYVPAVDLIDLSSETSPFSAVKRQFAPEYSQHAYASMLLKEISVGDYLSNANCSLDISVFARHQMVRLIEELAFLKEYKVETIFLAVSLADRYLVIIAVKREKAPCLIHLAVVCLLMAAKLEQPISPNFNRLIHLIREQFNIKLKKQDLVDMEE